MEAVDRKALGQLIARNREQRGLTQGALAKAAGITRPYLSQIESGQRMPSDDLGARLVILSGATMTDYVDIVRAAMTPEEANALATLLQPMEAMSQHMTPEQILAVMQATASAEQIAGAVGALADGAPPLAPGPDGWMELGKEDRRLVQRLINRLRTASTIRDEADEGGD